MWSFQYKHGDRPLEGYTIQQAAGRGGFGEVYYALSDAGREVALKVVTGYEQIELRGISQCMNLKSPHLVTIFDVKHNALGRPFVIMEYVSGPSLRQLLDQSPSGLGEQKAAFFLREIAKGLTFLHDCGIVHRDLKPGNIFYENGYVKIGDYGLSKAISTSQHSGQTVTVGTVHYMAPEVGAGKYDRSIDIYALGAVLYELLTGVPPYVGASPSEVLLKHLSAQPDCKGISEPFATVIKKAMAKDPAERYRSVQEMVEAVFGAEHVQQSMSVFSPEELSVVAGRAAKHVAAGAGSGGSGPNPQATQTLDAPPDPWGQVARRFEQVGQRIGQRFAGKGIALDPSRDMTVPVEDTLPLSARVVLAVVTALVMALAGAVLGGRGPNPLAIGAFIYVGILGSLLGLGLYRHSLEQYLKNDSRNTRRLLISTSLLIGLTVLAGWIFAADTGLSRRPGTWIGIIAALLLSDVDKWLRPDRRERVSLGHAIGMAVIAFVLSIPFRGLPVVAIAVTAGIALAAQALMPWDARRAMSAKAARSKDESVDESSVAVVAAGQPQTQYAQSQSQWQSASSETPVSPESRTDRCYVGWTVPTPIRFVWLGAFALAISLAIAFFTAAENVRREGEVYACVGVGFTALAILSLVRGLSRQYFGVWNYLLRPLMMMFALIAGISSAIIAGNTTLRGEEIAAAVFFMVFPAIVLIVLLFIPGKVYKTTEPPASPDPSTSAVPAASVEMPLHAAASSLSAPRAHASGLLSALAGLLIFMGTMIGLGLALDVPGAIAQGIFDPRLAEEIKREVFNGYNDWPRLVSRVAFLVAALTVLGGAVVLTVARRRPGWSHQLRGILGVGGLLCSLLVLSKSFNPSRAWETIQPLIAAEHYAAALDAFLNQWQKSIILAAALFLVSVIILARPASVGKAV